MCLFLPPSWQCEVEDDVLVFITTGCEFAAPKQIVPQPWGAWPTSLVGGLAVAALHAVISYCKWTKQVLKWKGKNHQVLHLAVRELTRTLIISGSILCPSRYLIIYRTPTGFNGESERLSKRRLLWPGKRSLSHTLYKQFSPSLGIHVLFLPKEKREMLRVLWRHPHVGVEPTTSVQERGGRGHRQSPLRICTHEVTVLDVAKLLSVPEVVASALPLLWEGRRPNFGSRARSY